MGPAYKMKMSTKPQIGLEFSDVEFPALLERLRGAGDLVQDVKEVMLMVMLVIWSRMSRRWVIWLVIWSRMLVQNGSRIFTQPHFRAAQAMSSNSPKNHLMVSEPWHGGVHRVLEQQVQGEICSRGQLGWFTQNQLKQMLLRIDVFLFD